MFWFPYSWGFAVDTARYLPRGAELLDPRAAISGRYISHTFTAPTGGLHNNIPH